MKNIYVVMRDSTSFRCRDMPVSAHSTEEEAKMSREEYLKTIPKRSHRHVSIMPVKWGFHG